MRRTTPIALAAILLAATLPATAAQKSKDAAYKENRAVIVVTGMRLDEDPANYRKDLSVAEGATVKLSGPDGKLQAKQTAALSRGKQPGGQVHFTADFVVDLDATYSVVMTFRDGTVVRVDDYRLPREWKTHFYFHATTGTLSPASILRTAEDSRTKLRLCVYAVYPLENYHKLGGS
jgi:hypothetical protein